MLRGMSARPPRGAHGITLDDTIEARVDRREREGWEGWSGGHVTREGEDRVQREQFHDLLTAAEVMPFIFGRLLISGKCLGYGTPAGT
ncbi:hypothetical protein EYF80_016928 [Liparis tanakae]|uniref:Uncharacterized protein n=1 Tax=Liparis tanakae TaxID=230148 RepID=A0A4Z2I499_9TELE|nr:hypothetical protein EYF80_016928 [Liparis tanakae]